MRARNTMTRARRRQEMLRDLVADEAVCVTLGSGYSRSAEAADALRRIRDGTYGVCADCNKRIPALRLQAKPEAARCVACQTEYESRLSGGSGEWTDVLKRTA